MKKLNLILSLIALTGLVLSFTSCDYVDPNTYFDEVGDYYDIMDEQIVNFVDVLQDTTTTVEDLQQEYDITLNMYNDNIDTLKNMKAPKNDPGYRTAVIDFYETVKTSLDNEYKQILDMYNSEWDDSFGEEIINLDDKAIDKIVKGENNVIEAQGKCADAFNITLSNEGE